MQDRVEFDPLKAFDDAGQSRERVKHCYYTPCQFTVLGQYECNILLYYMSQRLIFVLSITLLWKWISHESGTEHKWRSSLEVSTLLNTTITINNYNNLCENNDNYYYAFYEWYTIIPLENTLLSSTSPRSDWFYRVTNCYITILARCFHIVL